MLFSRPSWSTASSDTSLGVKNRRASWKLGPLAQQLWRPPDCHPARCRVLQSIDGPSLDRMTSASWFDLISESDGMSSVGGATRSPRQQRRSSPLPLPSSTSCKRRYKMRFRRPTIEWRRSTSRIVRWIHWTKSSDCPLAIKPGPTASAMHCGRRFCLPPSHDLELWVPVSIGEYSCLLFRRCSEERCAQGKVHGGGLNIHRWTSSSVRERAPAIRHSEGGWPAIVSDRQLGQLSNHFTPYQLGQTFRLHWPAQLVKK